MKKSVIIAILSILFVAGCKPLDEFQVNPNEATMGNPALFLTTAERNLFTGVLASSPLYSENQFLAARYWVGSNFHGEPYQYYRWAEGSFNAYNYLRNVKEMEQWADGNESYLALAKLFRSLFFYELTMRFGEIPYSQALQLSDEVAKPVYDSQKNVFLGILSDLETANELLSASTGVIQGDFIYQGDILKWRKFINSFKIRVLLALSNKENDPDLRIKERFVELMQHPDKFPVFSNNADNAQRITSLTEPSPYYSNSALIYMGLEADFTNALKMRRDPRLKYYAEVTSKAAAEGLTADDFDAFAGLPGSAPNEENTLRFNEVSIPSRGYIDVIDYEPVLYLGYYEVNFLIAEAITRGWWPEGDAQSYYEEGIRASMQYWQVSDSEISTYINQPLVAFNPATALELILMQKYYATYQNSGFEAYYTIRRTGIPEVDVSGEGMIEHRMAIRWRYPQREYLLNEEHVDQAVARQYPEGDTIYGTMWLLQ